MKKVSRSASEAFGHNLESYESLYRGEPAFPGAPAPEAIPWDIRQAQPRLMELEALGAISGKVLDAGCGLGDNVIYLAGRGYSVTGFDSSPTAIEQARTRASEAGVQARFDVADVTELTGYDREFDTVIDSALYHCLDHGGRQAYAAALHRATTPGARCFLYCFSSENVNGVIAPMEAVPEADIATPSGTPAGASNSSDPYLSGKVQVLPAAPEVAGGPSATDAIRAGRADGPYGRADGHHPAAYRRWAHSPAVQRRSCDGGLELPPRDQPGNRTVVPGIS